MTSTAPSGPTESAIDHPLRTFVALWRWYRPNLVGQRGPIVVSVLLTTAFLAIEAGLPLLTGWLLREGTWNLPGVVALLAGVLGSIGLSALMSNYATSIASASATVLRLRVFDALFTSKAMRQEGLARSSVVSRHTSDVDQVARAVEASLDSGLPNIVRVVQSLVLLTVVDGSAGITMWAATALFIVVHHFVGRRMIIDDHARHDASSDLSEIVDETISSAATVSGLGLARWQSQRFADASRVLERTTVEQGGSASNLRLGAQFAGLVGLSAVVIFALLGGASEAAQIAAALLYINAVVTGLLALPPWVRALQLAVVSRQRIDQVLTDGEAPASAETTEEAVTDAQLSLHDVSAVIGAGCELDGVTCRFPRTGLLALVLPSGQAPEALINVFNGETPPAAGRVTWGDHDVRQLRLGTRICTVGSDAGGFNVSIADVMRAADPSLAYPALTTLLDAVGLRHLTENPATLGTALGPGATLLTPDERQRLALAVALAQRASVLLIGPIVAMADPDTALRLITDARLGERQLVMVATSRIEVAQAADAVLYVGSDGTVIASHTQLLTDVPDYADHWQGRLQSSSVDLSVLGLSDAVEDRLRTRLVTQSFAAGETIYRQGAPADRTYFIISGHVEITVADAGRAAQRVAVLGQGMHCGDLRLSPGEQRAESARALNDCVVRSLSREAISAGLYDLLEQPPAQRRIMLALLRHGPATEEGLRNLVPDVPDDEFTAALDALAGTTSLVRDGDRWRVATSARRRRRGASDIHARLGF